MKSTLFICLTMTASLISGCICSKSRIVEQYKNYVSTTGEVSEASPSGLVYTLSIKPGLIQHLEDVSNNKELKERSKKSSKNRELHRLYLRLDIAKQAYDGRELLSLGSPKYSFNQLVEYYSFRFSKDLTIKVNGDEVGIANYFFQQNFNMGQASSVFLMVEAEHMLSENDILEVVVNNDPYEEEPIYFQSELQGSHLFSKSLIVYKR